MPEPMLTVSSLYFFYCLDSKRCNNTCLICILTHTVLAHRLCLYNCKHPISSGSQTGNVKPLLYERTPPS